MTSRRCVIAFTCALLAACSPSAKARAPSGALAATEPVVAHPAFVDVPAVLPPGTTIADFVRLHPGLTADRIATLQDSPPNERWWTREESRFGLDGSWTFEFRDGRLAGAVFQPDAAITRREHGEPGETDDGERSCERSWGAAQLDGCLRASRALIAELTTRYGQPTVDEHGAVVAAPSCARAINVLTATWSTPTARFRHLLWRTESKDEDEYLWAFVVVGPHDRFDDLETVHPVC